ncbi:TetR/AcrR family transcriptional regulator [Photobacterium sagamiensis]|uniref:TetR/AcrR family transcriptional regulator n=1 Tax=Photobacterium sagamiensis TaxID=2910241 RepID=UPI003D138ACB
MTDKVKRQRFSKEEWLEAGLKVLAEQGVDKLTINSLSRTVGVARTSFYWYFKDRQDLLNHMLEYWASVFTLVVTENPQLLQLEPAERLQTIINTVIGQKLLKYELAVRAWASHDESVKAVFDRIYSRRIALLRQTFADAGFDGDEQEKRAQTFLCYLLWGGVMQGDPHSHKKIAEKMIPTLLKKQPYTSVTN